MKQHREAAHIVLSIIVIISMLFAAPAQSAFAQSEDNLERQIEEKSKELQKLNVQIQQTQTQVNTLQGQAKTLQNALRELDYQIDQVTYGIRSSEISIDKLRLELQSLGYEVEDVGEEIDVKQEIVSNILQEVQQKDDVGLLEVLLRSGTLADGVFEIQTLRELQSSLSVSVEQLSQLREQLSGTIDATEVKKGALEEENLNLRSREVILADQQDEKDRLLVETKSQEGLYQQKLTELRSQQQAILDEISRIEDRLKGEADPSAIPGRRPGFFVWPVTLTANGGAGRITQVYGETAYSTAFYKGKPHNGTDIGSPIGTPVRAAADGKVVRVDYNGYYYQYGRYILVEHANNVSTLYAHLSQSAVVSGQNVLQGQVIGYVGNTGFTTGPHLHFGAYATPAGGWREVASRNEAGLVSVPPATGLVPIGVTLNPGNFL